MRVSRIFTALFAAGAIAMPLVKRQVVETDEVLVTEIDYVDGQGHVISKAYQTGEATPVGGAGPTPTPVTTPSATPTPANQSPPDNSPAPPSPPPADNSPAPAAPVASPSTTPVSQTGGSGGTSSGSSAAQAVQSYVQQNGNDDTLFVGWLEASDPRFGKIAEFHHNVHRLNHSTTTVSYNQSMADMAQAWAEKCITEEEVPEGSGMGMNVAFSSSTDNYNPSDWITGSWYNSEIGEYPGYGIADLPVGEGTNFNNWGHYSQVIWPGVTQVGCGVYSKCGGGFTVHSGCFYYPTGNIQGAFDQVNPPSGAEVVYPNGHNSM